MRVRSVARPGESMTSTLVRAVEGLEQTGVPVAGEARDAILIRLDDLDARLRGVETGVIQPEREGILTDQDWARLWHEGRKVAADDALVEHAPMVETPKPAGTGYPVEAKAVAVRAWRNDGIHAGLEACRATVGRAPDRTNARRLFKRWSEDPAVIAEISKADRSGGNDQKD